ncbi:MAG: glycosyltransferase [Candidatus Thorarchaeota archaeon]
MKILHICDGGLPDPRVERMALTMKKEGHELSFIGGKETRSQNLSVFSHTSSVSIGSGPRLAHDPRIRSRWVRAIEKANPDIVHAHDVLVGHFMLHTDIPAIFDDHENLSAQRFAYMSRSFIRRNAARLLLRKIPIWERQMAERYPVLTVSEGIANFYRNYTNDVNVLMNVPSLPEVEWLESPKVREGCVFIGSDFLLSRFHPARDMTGLQELIDFDIVTGLPHREMMRFLAGHKIGLTPYRPHPFQLVCNPNKNYEYLHAGLQVVLQRNLAHLFKNNPYVYSFRNYDDIRNVIDSVQDVDHSAIMAHSRRNYIWENQEDIIREAYKRA